MSAIDRLFAQLDVFASLKLDCSRCLEPVSLDRSHPLSAGGFICERCLVTMPGKEFRELCANARAVDAEWRADADPSL